MLFVHIFIINIYTLASKISVLLIPVIHTDLVCPQSSAYGMKAICRSNFFSTTFDSKSTVKGTKTGFMNLLFLYYLHILSHFPETVRVCHLCSFQCQYVVDNFFTLLYKYQITDSFMTFTKKFYGYIIENTYSWFEICTRGLKTSHIPYLKILFYKIQSKSYNLVFTVFTVCFNALSKHS